jgi:hypothetical protein
MAQIRSFDDFVALANTLDVNMDHQQEQQEAQQTFNRHKRRLYNAVFAELLKSSGQQSFDGKAIYAQLAPVRDATERRNFQIQQERRRQAEQRRFLRHESFWSAREIKPEDIDWDKNAENAIKITVTTQPQPLPNEFKIPKLTADQFNNERLNKPQTEATKDPQPDKGESGKPKQPQQQQQTTITATTQVKSVVEHNRQQKTAITTEKKKKKEVKKSSEAVAPQCVMPNHKESTNSDNTSNSNKNDKWLDELFDDELFDDAGRLVMDLA